MPVQYEKPRRLNFVSLVILAIAVAALYAAVKFGPVYYRRWKAAGAISEVVNKLYASRLATGEREAAVYDELRRELLGRFNDIGIDESTVEINFQKTPTSAEITANYREVVRHLFIDKTTTMEFTLSEDAAKAQDD